MRPARKNPLGDLIRDLSAPGTPAIQGVLDRRDLKIYLGGHDDLGLPIEGTDLERLLGKCVASQFGLRDQTILDPEVRHSHELVAPGFELRGTEFHEQLEALGPEIAHGLGFRGDLGFVLDKLVVYGPGQFFKPHRDSERDDTMIGTLVVVLPGEHRGGALLVRGPDGRQALELKGAGTRDTPLRWAALYGDCVHEVQPVQSGYRIALLFQILATKLPESTAVGPAAPELSVALRDYFKPEVVGDSPKFRLGPHFPILVCALEHAYSQRSLQWAMMKGSDWTRTEQLRAAAAEQGLAVGLGQLEFRQVFEAESPESNGYGRGRYSRRGARGNSAEDEDRYEIGGEICAEPSITRWSELAGHTLSDAQSLNLENDSVCWVFEPEDIAPDREHYEGYMGNYGNTLERWYARAALVIFPSDRRFELLFAVAPKLAFDEIRTERNACRLAHAESCVLAIANYYASRGHTRIDVKLASRLLRTLLHLGEPGIALDLLRRLELRTPSAKSSRRLAKVMVRWGPAWSQELWSAWSESRWNTRHPSLASARALIRALLAVGGSDAGVIAGQITRYFADRLTAESRALERYGESRAPSYEPKQWSVSTHRDLVRAWKLCWLVQQAPVAHELLAVALQHGPTLPPRDWSKSLRHMLGTPGLDDAARPQLHDALTTVNAKLKASHNRPPRTPGDWRMTITPACGGEDGRKFIAFLRSPERSMTWPLAKSRRRTVESIIISGRLPLTYWTERTGSPHKLQLRKELGLFEMEAREREEDGREWRRGRRVLRREGAAGELLVAPDETSARAPSRTGSHRA